MAATQQEITETTIRHKLAISVMIASLAGVIALAAVAVWREPAQAREILSTVLPVVGTWVGTVLAYYFTAANLDAATRSVTAIAREMTPDEKLRSIPVSAKMIPKAAMFFKQGPAAELKLRALAAEAAAQNKGQRIPILDANGAAVCVIHISTINQFLADKLSGPAPQAADTYTLQSMLDEAAIKTLLDASFACVAANATLADAKLAMKSQSQCQDVLVTQSGAKTEPVLGWLTNVIIEENSRV